MKMDIEKLAIEMEERESIEEGLGELPKEKHVLAVKKYVDSYMWVRDTIAARFLENANNENVLYRLEIYKKYAEKFEKIGEHELAKSYDVIVNYMERVRAEYLKLSESFGGKSLREYLIKKILEMDDFDVAKVENFDKKMGKPAYAIDLIAKDDGLISLSECSPMISEMPVLTRHMGFYEADTLRIDDKIFKKFIDWLRPMNGFSNMLFSLKAATIEISNLLKSDNIVIGKKKLSDFKSDIYESLTKFDSTIRTICELAHDTKVPGSWTRGEFAPDQLFTGKLDEEAEDIPAKIFDPNRKISYKYLVDSRFGNKFPGVNADIIKKLATYFVKNDNFANRLLLSKFINHIDSYRYLPGIYNKIYGKTGSYYMEEMVNWTYDDCMNFIKQFSTNFSTNVINNAFENYSIYDEQAMYSGDSIIDEIKENVKSGKTIPESIIDYVKRNTSIDAIAHNVFENEDYYEDDIRNDYGIDIYRRRGGVTIDHTPGKTIYNQNDLVSKFSSIKLLDCDSSANAKKVWGGLFALFGALHGLGDKINKSTNANIMHGAEMVRNPSMTRRRHGNFVNDVSKLFIKGLVDPDLVSNNLPFKYSFGVIAAIGNRDLFYNDKSLNLFDLRENTKRAFFEIMKYCLAMSDDFIEFVKASIDNKFIAALNRKYYLEKKFDWDDVIKVKVELFKKFLNRINIYKFFGKMTSGLYGSYNEFIKDIDILFDTIQNRDASFSEVSSAGAIGDKIETACSMIMIYLEQAKYKPTNWETVIDDNPELKNDDSLKDEEKHVKLYAANGFSPFPGYVFEVLKYGDFEHLLVGLYTDCCQRIGGVGAPAAIDSLINPLAGIILLRKVGGSLKRDIVSQSYFHYVPKDNGVILDNVEDNSQMHKVLNKSFGKESLQIAYAKLAAHLKDLGFSYVYCGKGYSDIGYTSFETKKIENDPRYFAVNDPYTDFKKNDFMDLTAPIESVEKAAFGKVISKEKADMDKLKYRPFEKLRKAINLFGKMIKFAEIKIKPLEKNDNPEDLEQIENVFGDEYRESGDEIIYDAVEDVSGKPVSVGVYDDNAAKGYLYGYRMDLDEIDDDAIKNATWYVGDIAGEIKKIKKAAKKGRLMEVVNLAILPNYRFALTKMFIDFLKSAKGNGYQYLIGEYLPDSFRLLFGQDGAVNKQRLARFGVELILTGNVSGDERKLVVLKVL